VGGYKLLGGTVCNPCYSRIRRQSGPCPSCRKTKVLAFFDGSGAIVCAACAGLPSRFACKTCGGEEQLTGSQCGTCRFRERARLVLAREDGTMHPELVGLFAHLLSVPDKRTVTRWLRHETIATTLRSMATGWAPVSHATLNLLPQSTRTRYLRQILISAGTLPALDVQLNDHEVFADRFLDRLSPAHAGVIRRYHRWHVLRVLRQQSAVAPIRPRVAYRCRQELKAIRDLLVWLDTQQLALENVGQANIDHYFARVSKTGPVLGSFIDWALKNRLASHIGVPPRRPAQPRAAMSDEKRWQEIERLSSDESVDMRARLAGLFILLFAQPVSVCSRLTWSDIEVSGTSVAVRFAADPIQMPHPVALLVRRYRDDPVYLTIYRTSGPDWLFDGRMPGSHLSEASLRVLLHGAGIEPRPAKEAAMRHLSSALPARIVSDAVGVSVGTATRWSRLSGGTWADYPDLR